MKQPNSYTVREVAQTEQTATPRGKKLLDQYRDALRVKRYSPRTEDTYVLWVKNFILFHNKRHPKEMAVSEIGQFLTHLASEKEVSASTQNQAFSAILFLYRHVLHIELDEAALLQFRPQRAKTVPTVLSKEEVKRLFVNLTGTPKLVAMVMYGGGLRVMETMRLRVKDIDLENHQIVVRDGKGENDRFTVLPDSLIQPLQLQLDHVKALHLKDLAMVLALFIFHLHWSGNIEMQARNGSSNMSFLLLIFPKTNAPASLAAIIFTKP